MSVLTDLIYGGANAMVGMTEGAVKEAIAKYGSEKDISFPDTAYYFPTTYASTGVKVEKLERLIPCVAILKGLITNQSGLNHILNAGLATAISAEILEGLKYLESAYGNEPGMGFLPDDIVRVLGEKLISGEIPGVAVVLGKEGKAADVVEVVRDYQSKGLLTFLVGDVIEQCAGMELGIASRVIPLGHDATAIVHAGTLAVRSALIFGGVAPGDLDAMLTYTKAHIPVFVNTFGAIDAVVVSACAGAIALGFPVVVDIDLAENQVEGMLVSVCDHTKTVEKSLELRNIRA